MCNPHVNPQRENASSALAFPAVTPTHFNFNSISCITVSFVKFLAPLNATVIALCCLRIAVC